MKPHIRIATCRGLPEPDADRLPLQQALSAAGITFEWLAWDDPQADWHAPITTVIRSTWNYVHAHQAFVAWAQRVAAVAPLWNDADVIAGNVHKGYLLDLAQRGVATVPTVLLPQHGVVPPDLFAAINAERIVIKPAIGAGSFGARWFAVKAPGAVRAAAAHAAAIALAGDVLLQPYVASVEAYGERSLVWLDGEFSHAIRKSPRFAGDHENIEGPLPITPAERALACAALAPLLDRILYARVDMANDDGGQPMIMEVELIEPSLFFAKQPGSADRYVAGLARRLLASAHRNI
ncbi:MAG: hypothetical protein KBG15_08565 [Kofleriaceae bacterium]|nr:hypothetical protein [Kofleriaceae bacterium]